MIASKVQANLNFYFIAPCIRIYFNLLANQTATSSVSHQIFGFRRGIQQKDILTLCRNFALGSEILNPLRCSLFRMCLFVLLYFVLLLLLLDFVLITSLPWPAVLSATRPCNRTAEFRSHYYLFTTLYSFTLTSCLQPIPLLCFELVKSIARQ